MLMRFLFLSLPLSLMALQDHEWMMQFDKIEKDNPVLGPLDTTKWFCPVRKEEVLWEEKDVFNPAAVVKDGKVHLIYRAEDKVGNLAGTSRLGLAISEDGTHFNERLNVPIFYPAIDENNQYEWEGGCEDPRVVLREDGTYIMTYTSYDGTARLCAASSNDLLNWKKHGPVFGEAFGKAYINAWTKSGSIVVEPQIDGRLVAVKIKDKYWMYWGENHIYLATSDDLINWTPLLSDDEKGFYRGRPDHQDLPVYAMKPLSVLKPRKGKFDSNLVEPGPPALLRDDGILFIYNSRNMACEGEEGYVCPKGVADPKLAPGTYSAGQALFSRDDPTKLLARSSDTFFKPTADFEITGQVGNVCFLEGLVYFKHKWFLYYGTADSKIAVAVATKYNYKGNLRDASALKDLEKEPEEIEEGDEEAIKRLHAIEMKAEARKGVHTGVTADVTKQAELIGGDPEGLSADSEVADVAEKSGGSAEPEETASATIETKAESESSSAAEAAMGIVATESPEGEEVEGLSRKERRRLVKEKYLRDQQEEDIKASATEMEKELL